MMKQLHHCHQLLESCVRRVHLAPLVLFVSRLVFGVALAQAGLGKLRALEQTSSYFASLALPAPGFMAVSIGSLELIAGVLLALGLFARLGGLLAGGVMIGALFTAHRDALGSLGALAEQAPMPYLIVAGMVAAFGAGAWSVDAMLHAPCAEATCQPSCTTHAAPAKVTR